MTLKDHLEQRILVLDGAMGTMIQNLGSLQEADYRNAELENHPSPLFGNSDPAESHQARCHSRHTRSLSRSRR